MLKSQTKQWQTCSNTEKHVAKVGVPLSLLRIVI